MTKYFVTKKVGEKVVTTNICDKKRLVTKGFFLSKSVVMVTVVIVT